MLPAELVYEIRGRVKAKVERRMPMCARAIPARAMVCGFCPPVG